MTAGAYDTRIRFRQSNCQTTIKSKHSRNPVRQTLTILFCMAIVLELGCSRHQSDQPAQAWNPKRAAVYLDEREQSWRTWLGAGHDHGTFCISCHTTLPYALSRPALRKALAETGPTVEESKLIANVRKRVRMWDEIEPYYSDREAGLGKTAESRGTESILNALILANYDAERGQLGSDTRSAFSHMWALQETVGQNRGSWSWLEFGHFEPWEADDSRYYGASLAALAIGMTPENYRLTPDIQKNLTSLREYLNHEYSNQSTINRVVLLWASTKVPGLLKPEQQRAIINEALKQQQADGGWRLGSLSWIWRGWSLASFGRMWLRSDGTFVGRQSDGYATGLIALVLQQAGVPPQHAQLRKALTWLARNQDKEGFWLSSSLNKQRSPSSSSGRFMSDAATSYSALALVENNYTSTPMSYSTANKRVQNGQPNRSTR
jgi:squalene-hopene/tetraprenyl-beta-curcumene cyclase